MKNIIRTLDDLIQTFELISSNSKRVFIIVWFNFFKIHFQNTKKKKEREAGGEPGTSWFIVWCSTPVPIWILKERRKNKRRHLETEKLLKNILQTVMKRLHLMKLKIESWNEVKKVFRIEITSNNETFAFITEWGNFSSNWWKVTSWIEYYYPSRICLM